VRVSTEAGAIGLSGGGVITTTFLAAGLIEEIALAVMPALLGSGIKLRGPAAPAPPGAVTLRDPRTP